MAQPLTAPAPHGRHVERVRQVVAVRRRAVQAARRLDRVSAALVGWGFAAVAVGLAAEALTGPGAAAGLAAGSVPGDVPAEALRTALRTALLVTLYVLAYRTEFVAASGSAVPTQPVLVALVLTTPTAFVPLAVLTGLLLGALGSPRAGGTAHTLATRAVPGWHCLGPVAVLAVADPGAPSLGHWRVYLLALAAQVVVDAVVAVVRAASLGVPPGDLVRPLAWTFAVDSLLACVGVAVVVAARGSWADVLLLAAPIGLVRLLAVDGASRLAAAVTLEDAWSREQQLARTDALTGLANRRAWNEAVAAAGLDGAPATVVVADLDGLKDVNDTCGHPAGDALIVRMAAVLRQACGDGPASGVLVARLGGDEFGVLARGDDPGCGAAVVAAVRRIGGQAPPADGPVLSASLGHAYCPPGGDLPAAVALADARAGQDKVARRVGRRAGDVRSADVRTADVRTAGQRAVPAQQEAAQAPDAATSSASASSVRTATPVPPTGV